ncbi:MAG: response regulator [Bdellovibrionales bacterium]|nr:response regulator [Bdellovibrionales bacterium]
MKKILVADDSLTIQKVIRLALSNESYDIQTVPDGKDALQQIPLARPDVVLIDVSLPSHSAFEVKRKINESSEFAGIQFILMSSAFEQVDESLASEVGFAGRLVKPFDPGNLREVLLKVLANVSPSPSAPQRVKPSVPSGGDAGIQLAPPDPRLVPNVPLSDSDDDGDDDGQDQRGDRYPRQTPDSFSDEPTRRLEMSRPPHAEESFPEPPAYGPEDGDQDLSGQKTVQLDSGATDQFVVQDSSSSLESQRALSSDLWSGGAPETDRTLKIALPQQGGGEEDIRQLTESTIKLSGLDDYQWSVNDGGAKKSGASSGAGSGGHTWLGLGDEPSLEPPRYLFDTGGSTFHLPPAGVGTGSMQGRSVYDDAPEDSQDYSSIGTLGGYSQPGASPSEPAQASAARSAVPVAGPAPGLTVGTLATAQSVDMLPLNPDELDALVQRHVQSALERLTRKLLPDIAERVLKEEIHKLLSNPP